MAANPYAGGWQAWDDRLAKPVLEKRNWQIFAGFLSVICVILAAGIVWFGSRVRYVVYAVQVDKLGYALTEAQPLTPSTSSDAIDRIQRYEVATFIREARGVTSDPQAEQERLNALLAHTRGAADRFLDEYYHADSSHNPFQIAQKQTVNVQIDSILQLSPHSYEVRWSEVRRDLNGATLGLPSHWEAELETAIVPPRDADTIVSNPIGFFVARISWTEQQD